MNDADRIAQLGHRGYKQSSINVQMFVSLAFAGAFNLFYPQVCIRANLVVWPAVLCCIVGKKRKRTHAYLRDDLQASLFTQFWLCGWIQQRSYAIKLWNLLSNLCTINAGDERRQFFRNDNKSCANVNYMRPTLVAVTVLHKRNDVVLPSKVTKRPTTQLDKTKQISEPSLLKCLQDKK